MAALAVKEKVGYSVGEIASNIIWMTIIFFLPNFYTDTFGLPAAVTGTMFLVVRLFDAVNDPMMGIIADRTNTKWGKFRPWILWMAVPYGIFGFLMFVTPDFSLTGKTIYAYATYMIMMVIYTAMMIPFSALSGVMTSDYYERTSLSSYRFVGAFVGGLLIQGLTLELVGFFGGGDDALGYQITMGIFALICIPLFLTTFATTKERITPVKKEANKLLDDLKDLTKNKPWIIIFALSLITLIYVALRGAVVVYYFQYYVGDKALSATFLVAGTVTIIISLATTKWLTKVLDKRLAYALCMAVVGLSSGAFYFLGPDDIVMMFALQIIFSFASGPTMPLMWSMMADTADYSEVQTGRRATALVFSASTFAQKAGSALGGAIALWILSYYGYVANEAQTSATLFGMQMMMSIYPMIGAFICTALVLFYSLDAKQLAEIEQILKQRKKEQGETDEEEV